MNEAYTMFWSIVAQLLVFFIFIWIVGFITITLFKFLVKRTINKKFKMITNKLNSLQKFEVVSSNFFGIPTLIKIKIDDGKEKVLIVDELLKTSLKEKLINFKKSLIFFNSKKQK